MTTMYDTRREVIDSVLDRIINDGDGEVYAEDINDIVDELGLLPTLVTKVSNTLDEIANHLKVVSDFKADPRAAWNRHYDGRYPGLASVESIESFHAAEAERGINFIIALTALS